MKKRSLLLTLFFLSVVSSMLAKDNACKFIFPNKELESSFLSAVSRGVDREKESVGDLGSICSIGDDDEPIRKARIVNGGNKDVGSQEYMVVEKTDGAIIRIGVDQIRQIFFLHPEIEDASMIVGTWKVDWTGGGDAKEYYDLLFFENGMIGMFTKNNSDIRGIYEGYYSIEGNILKNRKGHNAGVDYYFTILSLTENSFVLESESLSYYGTRINNIDKTKTKNNHDMLVGNWTITKNDVNNVDCQQRLVINEDGTFSDTYIDNNNTYEGQWAVMDDYVLFVEPKGKDPLGTFVIEKLTNDEIVLKNEFGKRIYGSKAMANTYIYREPFTTWGATVQQTKNYMKDYVLYKEENSQLIYYGNDKEILIWYSFEDAKLRSALVAVQTSSTTLEALEKQLSENGYALEGSTQDGEPIFTSSDHKTVGFIETNTEIGAFYVYYYDYEWLLNEDDETLYEEPYLEWGTARSAVKSNVNALGYDLIDESYSSSDNYYLVYQGKFKEDYSMYLFNSLGKLAQVNIFFQESTASVDNLRKYLSDNMLYTFMGTDAAQSQYFYLTKDEKSYAVATRTTYSDGTSQTLVIYVSYDSVSYRVKKKVRGDGKSENVFDAIAILPTTIWNINVQEYSNQRIIEKAKKRLVTLPSLPLYKDVE